MLFIVPHPIPGGKLTAKILNKLGEEVPLSEYDLEVDGEDFTFTFKEKILMKKPVDFFLTMSLCNIMNVTFTF